MIAALYYHLQTGTKIKTTGECYEGALFMLLPAAHFSIINRKGAGANCSYLTKFGQLLRFYNGVVKICTTSMVA